MSLIRHAAFWSDLLIKNFCFISQKLSFSIIWRIILEKVSDKMHKISKPRNRLYRCWWRILETKCVGDNFEMLFNISVGHQQPRDVTNIEVLSLTSKNCHRDKVTNISVAGKYERVACDVDKTVVAAWDNFIINIRTFLKIVSNRQKTPTKSFKNPIEFLFASLTNFRCSVWYLPFYLTSF